MDYVILSICEKYSIDPEHWHKKPFKLKALIIAKHQLDSEHERKKMDEIKKKSKEGK